MSKNYELWIDESGDFKEEEDVRWNPSLVGGVLINQEYIHEERLRQHFTDTQTHACEITDNPGMKILSHLSFIRQEGGHLVIFENKERVHLYSSRELYLRIFANGIVQILRQLSVDNDYFSLSAFIALRIDVDTRPQGQRIPDEEYLRLLEQYIKAAIRAQSLVLDPRTNLHLYIGSARHEYKLQFADSVCNARLTRTGRNKFTAEQKQQLEELYEDKYLFSMREKMSESWIKAYLADDEIAAALMELYTSPQQMDREKMMNLIVDRAQRLSYRLVSGQLNEFVTQMLGAIVLEPDFEHNEAMLKDILARLVPKLKQSEIANTGEVEFEISIILADMYLREGDIIHAHDALDRVNSAADRLDYKLEYMLKQYRKIEKQALYDINCFDYHAAEEKMSNVVTCIENMMLLLGDESLIQQHLDETMKSEYLGDALCMKIYADLFLQRENPQMYEQLCVDSDYALNQYQYEGELERNQQYRAHIEMEAGHYEEALQWLFKSALIVYEEDNIAVGCQQYLDKADREDYVSQSYYLMYYIEIFTEAALHGQEYLADMMYQKLSSKQELWTLLSGEIRFPGTNLVHENDSHIEIHEDVMEDIIGNEKIAIYHPMEIVYWKLATYQAVKGNNGASTRWYEKANGICNRDMDYTVIKIVQLGIMCEQLFFLHKTGRDYTRLLKTIEKKRDAILDLQKLPKVTRTFVESWKELSITDQTSIGQTAWELSRKIAF